MNIFPAIDLKDGRCVRLSQGNFADQTVYSADPVTVAREFAAAGAQWLHVVDLDGAQSGVSRQFDLIADIAARARLNVQAGGGLRDERTIARFLDAGIARVVIGSLAVKTPPLVQGWIRRFGPERIVLALDVRPTAAGYPQVLTEGWQSDSHLSLWSLLDIYRYCKLRTVLCTDVNRDGMLRGSNHDLYAALRKQWPELDVLASGGVDSHADLARLSDLGVAGAVIGKALYEQRIDLGKAVREAGNVG